MLLHSPVGMGGSEFYMEFNSPSDCYIDWGRGFLDKPHPLGLFELSDDLFLPLSQPPK